MKLSVQNYTLRAAFENDVYGTFEALSSMGLRYCEFAGLYGKPANELRALLDGIGMSVSGAHVGMDRAEDDTEALMDELDILGTKAMIVPWMDKASYENGWVAVRDRLATVQDRIAARGFSILYHNHDFEFQPDAQHPDMTGFDVILENEKLDVEIDLMWVAHAGFDPIAYLDKAAGRVPFVHLKELCKERGKDIEAGKGLMAWDAILPACDRVGVEFGVIEMDNPPQDPIVSVRECVEFFRAKGITE